MADISEKENLSESTSSSVEKRPQKITRKKLAILAVVIICVLIVSLIVFYQLFITKSQLKKDKKDTVSIVNVPSPPQIEKGKFATFQQVPVSFTAKVPKYSVKDDFSNVDNIGKFDWLIKQVGQQLRENYFVVTKGFSHEFFPIYEQNRYQFTPSFISSDAVFHSYHLLFNSLLETIEKNSLNKTVSDLTKEMLQASNNQYQELNGTAFENAAKRNIAFFAVSAKLLDENFVIPDIVKDQVEKELELISKHEGISISPVMAIGVFSESGELINPNLAPSKDELEALKEDYTQYIPRGHYEKSDLLKKYFKAVMWYGRLTFRFKNIDEIKSAVLISKALEDNKTYTLWEEIDEVISFFVGKSDDVDYYLLKKEMDETYGKEVQLKSLTDETKLSKLKEKLSELEPPAVNSIPIYQSNIQKDREKEIKGFRFMGQKFTIDASIFQKLICRDVGTNTGLKDCGGAVPGSRMLPNGLDIPASLGSDEAYEILDEIGETDYLNYPENLKAIKTYISSLSDNIWTQNLYWSWLFSLRPLTQGKMEGYPIFMQSKAWLRKQLNTFLASWAELKHDTILYSKQVYAEMGGMGLDEEKPDDKGYVEPEPYVYARLSALAKMTREGLTARNMIDENDIEVLKLMEDLCLNLKIISEKELSNEKLTDKQYELIRGFGGSLEHLFIKAMEDDCKDKNARQCMDDNPAAIIADVATDPNGQVLEVGIGKINPIYVLVMVEDKLKIAKGGVFSYYEFTWPMSDRLTDSKWRDLLTSDNAPENPKWTSFFLSD